jgi:hypothetical protein
MTAIEMPTSPGFTTSRFYLETNTQRFESPLTKTVQRVLLGGSRWSASYSLPAMDKLQAAAWRAFFLLLEGSTNTFNAFDPDHKNVFGAGGTPVVSGANQTGSTLTISGCTASALFLGMGRYFSVNGELKMLTSPAIADGSGNTTLNFKPALRSSPVNGAAIITARPSCTMVLSDDMQAAWDCDKRGIYQPKTFTAMEVFS